MAGQLIIPDVAEDGQLVISDAAKMAGTRDFPARRHRGSGLASREDVHRGEIVGDALVALFLGFTAERLSLVGSQVKISLPPLQSGGGQKRTGQEIMAGLGIFALGYKTSSRHMQSPGYNFPP